MIMKTIIYSTYCLVIFLIADYFPVLSQETFSFKQRLIITNDSFPKYGNQARFEAAVFGVETGATDGLDTSLGEFEIPNHPKPPQISAFFILPEESGGLISYIDLRGVPDDEKFYKEYTLDIQRGFQGRIFIQWTNLPEAQIDSAIFCDAYTGNLVRFDMMKTTKAEIAAEPSGINRFNIKVWYNKNSSVIFDNNYIADNINLYPNPVGDKLFINYIPEYYNYSIYSLLGEFVAAGKLHTNKSTIDLNYISKGIYILKLTDIRGNARYKKFIRK